MKPKYPHLVSFLLAILMMAALLLYGICYAHSVEQKYIHALANLRIPQSDLGCALQQIALEQPDLLMIYGSSEMLGGSSPYVAPLFFQNYPTGFNIYTVARHGDTSLDIAEDLAAIGPELRGKKIVFSFTPTMFNEEAVSPAAY
ncbi:MAG: D-alanyl-lipoteichoic acid biosynthesis protein DltD, partial [Anaerolineales bacterium]